MKSDKQQSNFDKEILAAIDKSLNTIEFSMDGTVITSNNNFLNMLGYTLEEVQGKHHGIFCEPSYVESHEYSEFWAKLNRGEFDSGEYKRIGKNGREVYIRATYNPIFDLSGKPIKILKIASDVTDQKRQAEITAKQAALIMDMSTPVMRLWDNILLLPIIGLVDSKRVQSIMEVLILDVQGVPAMDSSVANHIIKVTRATKLMGCTCIVTGISPEISQALVNLGIDLGDIMTKSSLKDGVNSALKSINLQLTETRHS
jgi:methyl-accepting chemotaxis protein